jgi:hypothetical protein
MTHEHHYKHTFKEDHGLINNYQDKDYQKNSKAEELIKALSVEPEKKEKYKKNDLSELDLYNMVNLDKIGAVSLIKNFFRKTKKEDHFTNDIESEEFITEKGIEYLNKTIEEAIGFYSRTLKRTIEKSFFEKRKNPEK